MKTAPANKKIREIITMIQEKKLIPRPEFQRRLVWTRDDKNKFIETILMGYPFPEIYFADGDVDIETGTGTQLLVDGQQRVNSIIEYFTEDTNFKLTIVPPYKSLTDDQKRSFLQYDVAVRDLGSLTKQEIVEVFRRINATKYSLYDIEIDNALYAGKFKKFAERIASDNFFIDNQVFNASDFKRMGDLKFTTTIISTMIGGYFNRDDELSNYLFRYNDDFDEESVLETRLKTVFEFILECGFDKKSRIWKKNDLFTIIIELDHIMNIDNEKIDPADVLMILNQFYNDVDNQKFGNTISETYYKAALQASNDKSSRIIRGKIINGILLKKKHEEIVKEIEN